MTVVAEAVAKAFGAEKMNYECLGNGDAHLHRHLFPGVNGNLDGYGNNGRGPVRWYPQEKMYSDNNSSNDKELKIMKQTLYKEIKMLLNVSKSQRT